MNAEPILTMSEVSKRFGGLLAVNDLSLMIYREQICGLIGPNGAGKTTVFNLITGVHKCSPGFHRFGKHRPDPAETSRDHADGICQDLSNHPALQ